MNDNIGYHKNTIIKGTLGSHTKITEEYLEFIDAIEQDNKIMALLELSDLIGAIERFADKFNISLQDIINMKEATKRSFESGNRK